MYIHLKMAQDLVVKFVTVRACELVKRISTVNDTTGICFKYHGEEDSKQIISVNIAECFFITKQRPVRRQIKHRVQRSPKHYN